MIKKFVIPAILLSSFVFTPVYAINNREATRIVEQAMETSEEYCGVETERIIHHQGRVYLFYLTSGIPGESFEHPGQRECSGGSGSSMFHLAVLDESGKVMNIDVLNPETNGPVAQINTRLLDVRSAKISGNELTFVNNEYGKDPNTGEDDPNCCARDRYLNRFRLSDMKLLGREFIDRDPQ